MRKPKLLTWQMNPSDQDLNRFLFLRLKKQNLSRRPVTAHLASEIVTQSGKDSSPESIHGQEFTQVPITTSFYWTREVTDRSRMNEDLVRDLKVSDLFPQMSERNSNNIKDSLQYDFLLEGLLTEWRKRRQKVFNPAPEFKPSNRSFFPHQHNQIKYWAWPFLGMVALASSLPFVHSRKRPLVSTLQPYYVEVQLDVAPEDFERMAALPSAEMPLFENLAYTPNEATTSAQPHFEQTLGLDLATNEVEVSSQHSGSTVQHPMANLDYSKTILELFVKKAYCKSFRPEFGYPKDLVVTTSESESYYPSEPMNIDQIPVKEVPEYLKMLDLEDTVFSRDCLLPIMCSKAFWGRPVLLNPGLYRELEQNGIYKYVQSRVSTEADYLRKKRRSVQFASRPFDRSLRLAVSLKELNLFKNFANPRKAHKVKGKSKSKVDVQFWKAAMDSKQWMKTLVLNSDRVCDNLLSNTQPSANAVPTTIRLSAQDWPTLPTQFTRISKASLKRPTTDTASFLTPLMDPQQPIDTVVDILQSPPIAFVLQESFPEVTLLSRRLSTWITDWLSTWSLMYSTTEGVLNDATFTNQFNKTLGKPEVQTNKWTRPQAGHNPNYQTLAETDSIITGEFPEKFFRASLTYQNTKGLPPSMSALSEDYTRMLERTQEPLRFHWTSQLGKGRKERPVKTLPHPTVGSLFKTFVFRSSSYLEDPYFEQKRRDVRRRRSARYKRVGLAVKKRKRINPRPAWLRPLLYHPILKLRHSELVVTTPRSGTQITAQQGAHIPSTFSFQKKSTPKYLTAEGPSLFRQNSLHHSLMGHLPQLTELKYFQVAKWGEPKSKLKSWRAFLVNEFGPYTKRLNSNFKDLKAITYDKRFTKFNDLPQWFWKGSHSASDIDGLRFKQNLITPLFTQRFAFGAEPSSEAMMSHLLLNELRLVARQNEAIYKRLNQTFLRHRNKHVFMAATRPHLSSLNRVRVVKHKKWAWPAGWSQVVQSPFDQLQSQWVLKESHLLRNSNVNDVQHWWNITKLRKRNKAARESHEKGLFRLRLPFRNRKKVHPITVGRAWKKRNLMDHKLTVFGLINNRAELYPRQLKLRFQKERGATQLTNLQLTPPERDVQKYMNRSVAFWWNETESQLLSLINPMGTHPWNLFEGFMALPQLTSESQPLGITLINGSLILLHVALVSFLIQLPETRTLLRFYALVVNRIGSSYLWMAGMCYWLLQECVYEIQYALFCGRVLVIPPKDPRRFTYKMLAKQLHRAERSPRITGQGVYRSPQSILACTVREATFKQQSLVPLINMCIERYYQLEYERELDRQARMEREMEDANPGSDSPNPGSDSDSPNPGSDGTGPGSDGTGPGPDGRGPGPDGAVPGPDGTNPDSASGSPNEMSKAFNRELERRAKETKFGPQEADFDFAERFEEYLERVHLEEQAQLERMMQEPSEPIMIEPKEETPVALAAMEEPTSEEEKNHDEEVKSESEDEKEKTTEEEKEEAVEEKEKDIDLNELFEKDEDEEELSEEDINEEDLSEEDVDEEDLFEEDIDTDEFFEEDEDEEPTSTDESSSDEESKAKKARAEYESEPLYFLHIAAQLMKDIDLPETPVITRLRADLKRAPWWSYDTVSGEEFPPSTDDLTIRLAQAEGNWTAWDYGALYMKERHKVYKQALPVDYFSVQERYQRALHQSVYMKDVLSHHLYKGLFTFTKSVVGLYFFISRKYYRFYSAVDMAIATARRLLMQFLEEPAENTIQALNFYFLLPATNDLLSARDDGWESLQTLKVEFYARQMNAFGPFGILAQRRLQRLADDAYIACTKPDMDLLMRHQKSLIFWNMWGAVLIRAISRYQLSMADLLSTKEEQEKLVECLITEDDWSWTQQSLLQFQPLFDLFSLGKRTWNDFSVSPVTKEFGNPPMLEEVLHPQTAATQAAQKKLTALEAFEKQNPADVLYSDNHAMSLDELSWRWGAQQMKMYHSRLTALPIEYQPAGNLQAVPQLKYYYRTHTQLGWIIEDNLRTTFTNTPSKNALIIGPPGPEVTSLIRAVVGELEMKLITDNARRYTTVIRNVAIGVRHLKEVFYSVAVEAPCLFVLEDIHLIGRRRELLIAEDEELYLLERSQVSALNEDYEEDYSIDKFEKHTLLHYEKPFRGDYSFLISTNCFAFDYFVEPAPSRMRRLGRFTESRYKMKAIEQELVKLRGLENLSNAQAKAPALSLTSTLQARQPVKEVKAAPNSPLTVAIEKNKKAFRPRRIVKNMPLQGISWDMWMLLSRYDYSIRSKVALLAVLTEDAVGELTDMITDLLVMMDTVRATRGVIMFATTHAPTSLDPALRRPGRLDETLTVPLFSSIETRWEVLKLRLEDSDPLQELAPYALVTRNLSNYEVSELALQSTLAILPKKVSLAQTTNLSASPIKALKAQMQMSYLEAFVNSKGFDQLKEQMGDLIEVPSEKSAVETQMRQRKFQIKVNTLAYSLVGAHLIHWKAKVITDQLEAEPLAYSVEKVHPLLNHLEHQNEYFQFTIARTRDPLTVREHVTNSLAPRFAETFFTSALLSPSSGVGPAKDLASLQFTFQLHDKTNYVPLTFQNFELAATRFKPGGSSGFTTFFPAFRNNLINLGVPASRTSDFISTVIQKRAIWTKNLVVYRLLYLPMNQDYREAYGLPMYDVTDPYKHFETLQKELRVLYRPGNLTMNEKFELHKNYRLFLALANRTIEDWHAPSKREERGLAKRDVLPSLEELKSLALVMNHPSGTQSYYRDSMHLRQRFHLIDQWWNGHLEDYDIESTLMSDVETRTFFEESIGNDVEIEYPQPEKYYNVRSRRWIWKRNAESWFLKGAKFTDAAAYHYMVCALTRCYEELHKNRESLDHLAYTFLKSGSVSELETFSHYTRFYQTDV